MQLNVSIRPWQTDDCQALANYANNFRVWKNLRDSFPFPYTIEDAKSWIGMQLAAPKPMANLAITVDDLAVGGIGIIPQQDIFRFNAEVGFWLGEFYWKKGVCSKALSLFLGYVKEQFPELKKLFAHVFESNEGSAKVLINNGFRKEGFLEDHVYKNNEFQGQYIFSLFL